MPSELKSIFELKSPNPKGMVTEKKGKQEAALGASWLAQSLLISTTQGAMEIGYEMAWKEAQSPVMTVSRPGIKADMATFLL